MRETHRGEPLPERASFHSAFCIIILPGASVFNPLLQHPEVCCFRTTVLRFPGSLIVNEVLRRVYISIVFRELYGVKGSEYKAGSTPKIRGFRFITRYSLTLSFR